MLHRPTCSRQPGKFGGLVPPPTRVNVGDMTRHNPEAIVPLKAMAGRRGGQSRASHLTPEQRSEAARKAANIRWTPHRQRQIAILEAATAAVDAALAESTAAGGPAWCKSIPVAEIVGDGTVPLRKAAKARWGEPT